MSLYPDARSALSPADQTTLELWERAASAIPPEGPNVVANLRNESHLVGNPPELGTSALQAFLLRIASLFAASGAKEAFEEAVGGHCLEGRPLASNPGILYRFRPVDAFGESVARANGDISDWMRNRERYVTDLLENWDTIGKESVSRAMLGVHPCVFATFEKRDGKVVTDFFAFGREIMEALGVRLHAIQDVVGVRYPPPPDVPLQYPTSADGGWNQDFVVSKPTDPHGWTRPISNPTGEGWPEAVHQNHRADLVVEKPLRYPN